MRLSFAASAVAVERDDDLNVEYLVLAEHHDRAGRRFEVQRPLEADEQDKALGQDTYCLVTESGATHYGGVRRWRVDDAMLVAELDATAAQTLGTDTLSIGLPPGKALLVERALRMLLR